jgi:predicted nucleic acid-binding protein
MSAEARLEFVDANILVYAYDSSAGAKRTSARQLLERLWASETGAVSVQVLQEFFVAITRKVPKPLTADVAAGHIRDFSVWRVFSPTVEDVLNAMALQKQAGLSFWDAMVVEAAAELGAQVLWTEDLNHGQRIRGVQVQDPFI